MEEEVEIVPQCTDLDGGWWMFAVRVPGLGCTCNLVPCGLSACRNLCCGADPETRAIIIFKAPQWDEIKLSDQFYPPTGHCPTKS